MVSRQLIGIMGERWFEMRLLRDDIECANPIRDKGIDLIAFFIEKKRLMVCPIQVKSFSTESFSLSKKYENIPNLLLIYIQNLGVKDDIKLLALTYDEAHHICTKLGYTNYASWKKKDNNGYFYANKVSQRLKKELARFEFPDNGELAEKIKKIAYTEI